MFTYILHATQKHLTSDAMRRGRLPSLFVLVDWLQVCVDCDCGGLVVCLCVGQEQHHLLVESTFGVPPEKPFGHLVGIVQSYSKQLCYWQLSAEGGLTLGGGYLVVTFFRSPLIRHVTPLCLLVVVCFVCSVAVLPYFILLSILLLLYFPTQQNCLLYCQQYRLLYFTYLLSRTAYLTAYQNCLLTAQQNCCYIVSSDAYLASLLSRAVLLTSVELLTLPSQLVACVRVLPDCTVVQNAELLVYMWPTDPETFCEDQVADQLGDPAL